MLCALSLFEGAPNKCTGLDMGIGSTVKGCGESMLRDGERCIAIMGPSTLIVRYFQSNGRLWFSCGGGLDRLTYARRGDSI